MRERQPQTQQLSAGAQSPAVPLLTQAAMHSS